MADEDRRLPPAFEAAFEKIAQQGAVTQVDLDAIRTQAHAYCDTEDRPDPFFNVVASLGLVPFPAVTVGQLHLLDFALDVVHEWEASHPGSPPRHKGSGYYFAGMAHILLGDLDTGFLLMHQAFEEDKRLSGMPAPRTPALAFIILDSDEANQAFLVQVQRYAVFLEGRLAEYRSSGRGSLTLPELRSRALARPDKLLLPLFQTVFVVARLLQMEASASGPTRDNHFADLLLGQLALDLCLVVDGALAGKFGPHTFLPLAADYLKDAKLRLREADLHKVNERRKNGFEKTLRALLKAGSFGNVESDLLVTYVIRNQMAHGLAAERSLRELFPAIEPRLLFTFFGIVERSYRP